jgi:DNA repair protein RecO (recombination protein O)
LATPRDQLQHCFVLHRRDFGNTSLILEVLSAAYGRLPALAKGAKRGRNPTAAILQPFRPLWLCWSGRGEVKTLTRSEPAGRALPLEGEVLFCGFYLNELLVRMLGRCDPHEDLFAFYHGALTDLGTGADAATVLRQFELRLLQELGYLGALDLDADGIPVAANRRYLCVPDGGLRGAGEGERASSISGATLLGLASGAVLAEESAREARILMRRLLAPHLGERPLKSRELFQRWRGSPN